MGRTSRFLKRSYWRKRAYRLSTRLLIRPSIDWRNLPLVAVTGTNGKTAVTLLISRILADAGYRVGTASTEGVQHRRDWVRRGDYSGAKGVWYASRRLGLDAVVVETARGGIIKNGLGFSRCHVSVVTNVTADHLGLGGVSTVEEMAEVKATLPEHTRPDGTTVLNVDQPLVHAMARKSPARPVFFSLTTPPETTSDCFFVRDGTIFRKRGADVKPVIATQDIYLTHGGHVTFQVANAMAALAAIEALAPWLPVPPASLARSLAEFGRNPRDLPLRFQLFRHKGLDVLLSSSKNPETYAQETALVHRLATAHGYRRVVCVLSNVGDRDESHYRTVSHTVAQLADVVVCVPPTAKYLRTRTGEEIVELLARELSPGKVVRVAEVSLAGLASRFVTGAAEPTLFVLFAAKVLDQEMVEDILEHGERLPMCFAP